MFHITFSPMRRDDRMALSATGNILMINGAALDLSALPEGATLPQTAVACDWLAGDITRQDGALQLALILPLGPDAPESARFPARVTSNTDGSITLPTDIEDPAA